jgi:cold shock CspA family protein
MLNSSYSTSPTSTSPSPRKTIVMIQKKHVSGLGSSGSSSSRAVHPSAPPTWIPFKTNMQLYCEPFFVACERWRTSDDIKILKNRILCVEAINNAYEQFAQFHINYEFDIRSETLDNDLARSGDTSESSIDLLPEVLPTAGTEYVIGGDLKAFDTAKQYVPPYLFAKIGLFFQEKLLRDITGRNEGYLKTCNEVNCRNLLALTQKLLRIPDSVGEIYIVHRLAPTPGKDEVIVLEDDLVKTQRYHVRGIPGDERAYKEGKYYVYPLPTVLPEFSYTFLENLIQSRSDYKGKDSGRKGIRGGGNNGKQQKPGFLKKEVEEMNSQGEEDDNEPDDTDDLNSEVVFDINKNPSRSKGSTSYSAPSSSSGSANKSKNVTSSSSSHLKHDLLSSVYTKNNASSYVKKPPSSTSPSSSSKQITSSYSKSKKHKSKSVSGKKVTSSSKHKSIGTRIATYFFVPSSEPEKPGQTQEVRLFSGEITNYIPPTKPQNKDQKYIAVFYDNKDEEEYILDQKQYQDAIDLYEVNCLWTVNHPSIGTQVADSFYIPGILPSSASSSAGKNGKGGTGNVAAAAAGGGGAQKIFVGKVVKYCPPSSSRSKDQLYHILWEDGDEADYDEYDYQKGKKIFRSIQETKEQEMKQKKREKASLLGEEDSENDSDVNYEKSNRKRRRREQQVKEQEDDEVENDEDDEEEKGQEIVDDYKSRSWTLDHPSLFTKLAKEKIIIKRRGSKGNKGSSHLTGIVVSYSPASAASSSSTRNNKTTAITAAAAAASASSFSYPLSSALYRIKWENGKEEILDDYQYEKGVKLSNVILIEKLKANPPEAASKLNQKNQREKSIKQDEGIAKVYSSSTTGRNRRSSVPASVDSTPVIQIDLPDDDENDSFEESFPKDNLLKKTIQEGEDDSDYEEKKPIIKNTRKEETMKRNGNHISKSTIIDDQDAAADDDDEDDHLAFMKKILKRDLQHSDHKTVTKNTNSDIVVAPRVTTDKEIVNLENNESEETITLEAVHEEPVVEIHNHRITSANASYYSNRQWITFEQSTLSQRVARLLKGRSQMKKRPIYSIGRVIRFSPIPSPPDSSSSVVLCPSLSSTDLDSQPLYEIIFKKQNMQKKGSAYKMIFTEVEYQEACTLYKVLHPTSADNIDILKRERIRKEKEKAFAKKIREENGIIDIDSDSDDDNINDETQILDENGNLIFNYSQQGNDGNDDEDNSFLHQQQQQQQDEDDEFLDLFANEDELSILYQGFRSEEGGIESMEEEEGNVEGMELDDDNDSIEGLTILAPTRNRRQNLVPAVDDDFHLINLHETDSLATVEEADESTNVQLRFQEIQDKHCLELQEEMNVENGTSASLGEMQVENLPFSDTTEEIIDSLLDKNMI